MYLARSVSPKNIVIFYRNWRWISENFISNDVDRSNRIKSFQNNILVNKVYRNGIRNNISEFRIKLGILETQRLDSVLFFLFSSFQSILFLKLVLGITKISQVKVTLSHDHMPWWKIVEGFRRNDIIQYIIVRCGSYLKMKVHRVGSGMHRVWKLCAISLVIWTYQNDLGLNLYIVPPISCVVTISENGLVRSYKERSKAYCY